MAKLIDRDTPLKERLRALGIDYDFMKFLLHWCGALGFRKEAIADERFKGWFGKKTVHFHQDIFSRVPFSNREGRPPRDALWAAVSYMHDYFCAKAGGPNWRLMEEFLQSFRLWGKSSLKSAWHKGSKRRAEISASESYRLGLKDLQSFYDCHKKHFLIAMAEAENDIPQSEKPIFWSVKLVYSG